MYSTAGVRFAAIAAARHDKRGYTPRYPFSGLPQPPHCQPTILAALPALLKGLKPSRIAAHSFGILDSVPCRHLCLLKRRIALNARAAGVSKRGRTRLWRKRVPGGRLPRVVTGRSPRTTRPEGIEGHDRAG